jgi:hypothetical protein
MIIHESDLYHLRGSGIGSIFSSIYRSLIPIASKVFRFGSNIVQSKAGQKVLKAAKRSATKAGLQAAHDALQGENIGKTLKKRGKQAGLEVIDSAMKAHEELETGEGIGRKSFKYKFPLKRSIRKKRRGRKKGRRKKGPKGRKLKVKYKRKRGRKVKKLKRKAKKKLSPLMKKLGLC